VNPIFLSVDDILQIHQDQIGSYGGTYGIRDINLLRSAAAVPAVTFEGQFLHTDLAEMAAAYLFHIVNNHPFVDGNKRAGAASALVFLEMNEAPLDATEDDLVDVVMSVASGTLEKTGVIEFFRAHTLPTDESEEQ